MTLYILTMLFILLFLYLLAAENKLDKLGIEKQKFAHPFFNWMYRYSNIAPFIWFADDDEDLTKKGLKILHQLKTGNLTHILTVRSYMGLTFLFLVISVATGGLLVYLQPYLPTIVLFLFDVDVSEMSTDYNMRTSIMIMMLSLLIALVPNWFLKARSKKTIVANSKELPVVQMFIVLMLRSGKTVSEIIYGLSKLQTPHKKTFEHAYRVYVRSPQEAMDYLRKEFSFSRFADSFDLLEDVSEYARTETITIMEAGMNSLVEEIEQVKRRNDLSNLVYSQASMIAPFSAIILLGAVPFLIMGLSLFGSAQSL